MSIDPETLIAYADGDLDPVSAKRIARAVAADPELARQVAEHRRLRARLANGLAPIATDGMAARFTGVAPSNVVAFPKPAAPRRRRWPMPVAIAGSLIAGVLLGQAIRPDVPVTSGRNGLTASGALARSLDTQLSATQGATPIRILATVRTPDGTLCRSFAGRATSGLACRDGDGWTLRRTTSGAPVAEGAALDATAEAAARTRRWR